MISHRNTAHHILLNDTSQHCVAHHSGYRNLPFLAPTPEKRILINWRTSAPPYEKTTFQELRIKAFT
jgi:hypothetical protein